MIQFSWNEKVKDMYYKKAEELIRQHDLPEKIQVDRSQFWLSGKDVKVSVVPISSRENFKLWQQVKKIKGFTSEKWKKNDYGRKQKPIFYRGFFTIERDLQQEEEIERGDHS